MWNCAFFVFFGGGGVVVVERYGGCGVVCGGVGLKACNEEEGREKL